MEENIKKQLISEIGQTYGYEKTMELIDSIEYIDYLNDDRINTVIEFFYNANQKLISDNTLLIEKINLISFYVEKLNSKSKNKIYIINALLISLCIIITYLLLKI